MAISFFSEECISEELNNAFFMTPIWYNWNGPLDRFMMNADIKLFLMGLSYTMFDELNNMEVRACFEYAVMERYKVLVWGDIQKQGCNH
jgi:hypothetical protein